MTSNILMNGNPMPQDEFFWLVYEKLEEAMPDMPKGVEELEVSAAINSCYDSVARDLYEHADGDFDGVFDFTMKHLLEPYRVFKDHHMLRYDVV